MEVVDDTLLTGIKEYLQVARRYLQGFWAIWPLTYASRGQLPYLCHLDVGQHPFGLHTVDSSVVYIVLIVAGCSHITRSRST